MESEVTKGELAKLLYESIGSKSYERCEELLELRGADPNYILDGHCGSAPIHFAVAFETEEIAFMFVHLLLKYEGDPNLRNWEGTTPLMVAAIWERLQILQLLLDFGGDPDLLDNDGYSTIDYAKDCSDPSIYGTLVHHRDIFVTEQAKCSPTRSLKNALNENIIYRSSDFSDVGSAISYVEVYVPLQEHSFHENNSPPPPLSDVSNFDLSSLSSCPTEKVREELRKRGMCCMFNGPVVKSTKGLYMNRLKMLKKGVIRDNDDENITNDDVKIESAISYVPPPPLSDVSNCDQSSGSLSSCPTENVREELRKRGMFNGPVVKSTKGLYMNRLKMLKKGVIRDNDDENITNDDVKIESAISFVPPPPLSDVSNCNQSRGYNELLNSCFDRSKLPSNLERWKVIELELTQSLRNISKSRYMGEKVFFTYLLLDPRITQEIVRNEPNLEEVDLLKLFIKAIFYVGKGKNARPTDHLYEAAKTKEPLHSSSKIKRIHEIWNEQLGIVCIYAFHNITCPEAHIREAAMLNALDGLHLTNQQKGQYFPPASSWPLKKKMQLGALLLYRAMKIYLGEGESQIMRSDL